MYDAAIHKAYRKRDEYTLIAFLCVQPVLSMIADNYVIIACRTQTRMT